MDPRRLAVLVLFVCALVLPFLLWGFRTYQLAFAATHAIAILGLNLIAGQAGVISLGHGAFYGLGAYTLAVLMRHAGVSAYLGIFAAALMCLAAGYLFGRVVSRLARFYLALATFSLALAVPQTLKSSYLAPWTGGVQGSISIGREHRWASRWITTNGGTSSPSVSSVWRSGWPVTSWRAEPAAQSAPCAIIPSPPRPRGSMWPDTRL